MRGANNGEPTKFIVTSRWIPDKGDSGRLYFSTAFAVHPDIMLGVDYRPLADQVGGFATWRVLSEGDRRPAVIMATSNDDFTVNDEEINSQSVSAVAAKALIDWNGWSASPYAGAVYLFELEELRPVAGASVRYDRASVMLQYSGTDIHLSASYDVTDQLGVSFIHWGLKYPGVGMRFRF